MTGSSGKQQRADKGDLARTLERDGASAFLASLAAEGDDAARHRRFAAAIHELGGGTGASAERLDAMVAIGEAAIADALRVSEARREETPRWIDAANIHAYNLAANLCDCWGDGESRARRHFEAGLAFAERALAWRLRLEKPPGALAMAHWARGKHLLSLGRNDEATRAFAESLECERMRARQQQNPDVPALDAAPSLIAAASYAAAARIRMGASRDELDRLMSMLRAQADAGGERGADARVYLDQLAETLKQI
jgi:hypothetical protein